MSPRKRLAALLLTFSLPFWTCPSLSSAAEAADSPSTPASELRVSMDFRKTEIGDVLRLLAKQYDLNIILSEDVVGPISVRFSQVTIDEALDAIVTVNGYAYSRRGRVIRVTTPDALEQEAPTTQVVSVRYATAKKLLDPLKTVLSARGIIQADDRSNSLVVSDYPSNLQMITQVVQKLDVPTAQVLIETRIIETVLSDEERLGLNWNLQASLQGGAMPTTFPFPQGTAIPNPVSQFRPIGQTAAESTTTNTATGATATSSSTAFPSGAEGMTKFPFVSPSLFTFGTLSFNQFQVLLQALETRAQTKALASPSIVTMDNQEAQIVVGTNVPIPTFERSPDTGDYEITGYIDKKTGVVLRVTPHVSKDGSILLDIHPQVSSITRFVGDPRAQVPVTSSREADTQVSLKSGETVVIGGLIDDREVQTKRGVPGLSKIPGLGRLFRFDETTRSRTDVLIFITAHILTDEQRIAQALKAVAASGRSDLFQVPAAAAEGKKKKAAPGAKTQEKKPFKIQLIGTPQVGTSSTAVPKPQAKAPAAAPAQTKGSQNDGS